MDSLAALVAWAGLSADTFVDNGEVRANPGSLTMISTYLKGDPSVVCRGGRGVGPNGEGGLRTAEEHGLGSVRRGFKTEANAIAREVRKELGLDIASPLDVGS